MVHQMFKFDFRAFQNKFENRSHPNGNKKSKNLLHFPMVCGIIWVTDVKFRNSPVWWNWQTHGT